jgi:hypothetical protein
MSVRVFMNKCMLIIILARLCMSIPKAVCMGQGVCSLYFHKAMLTGIPARRCLHVCMYMASTHSHALNVTQTACLGVTLVQSKYHFVSS